MANKKIVSIHQLTEQRAREIILSALEDTIKLEYSAHAQQRMQQRGISPIQVMRCLKGGRFDESPHRLPCGDWRMAIVSFSAGASIKVVTDIKREESGGYVVVVTVY